MTTVGLRPARLAVFGGIPWQRCQFHLQQNAQAYVPRKDMQAEVAEDTPALAAGANVRTIFNAPDRTTAEAYLAKAVEKYRKTASPPGRMDGREHPGRTDGFSPSRLLIGV